MVILFWIISILILAVFIGEIRFRQLKVIKNNEKIIIKKWTDSIDKDMGALEIETSKSELTSAIMNINNFKELLEYEYSKKL